MMVIINQDADAETHSRCRDTQPSRGTQVVSYGHCQQSLHTLLSSGVSQSNTDMQ